MNHPHIIGLTGPAGSGKDTVADLLAVHAGFTKMAFAETLRTEVMLAFAIDPSFLTQRETKETPMRCLALSRCLDEGFIARMIIMHTLKGEPLDLDAPRSPRQIMQWWGTDYRRHQSADYWVNALLKRANYLLGQRLASRIVVTDCRFSDEVDAVRIALRGQLWQVWRDGVVVAPGAHVSEVTGAEFRPDVVINNSHSVKHLQERVLEAYWASCAGLTPGSLQVRIAEQVS
jgi:hypothetical protein